MISGNPSLPTLPKASSDQLTGQLVLQTNTSDAPVSPSHEKTTAQGTVGQLPPRSTAELIPNLALFAVAANLDPQSVLQLSAVDKNALQVLERERAAALKAVEHSRDEVPKIQQYIGKKFTEQTRGLDYFFEDRVADLEVEVLSPLTSMLSVLLPSHLERLRDHLSYLPGIQNAVANGTLAERKERLEKFTSFVAELARLLGLSSPQESGAPDTTVSSHCERSPAHWPEDPAPEVTNELEELLAVHRDRMKTGDLPVNPTSRDSWSGTRMYLARRLGIEMDRQMSNINWRLSSIGDEEGQEANKDAYTEMGLTLEQARERTIKALSRAPDGLAAEFQKTCPFRSLEERRAAIDSEMDWLEQYLQNP